MTNISSALTPSSSKCPTDTYSQREFQELVSHTPSPLPSIHRGHKNVKKTRREDTLFHQEGFFILYRKENLILFK